MRDDGLLNERRGIGHELQLRVIKNITAEN